MTLRRHFLALLILPTLLFAAPSAEQIAGIEKKFADWLAQPAQLGAPPKRIKYLGSETTRLPGAGVVPVHIVEYETADGAYGKGFANPVPMSFGALPYRQLSHAQLVTAYTGWLLLASGLEDKTIATQFAPRTLPELQAKLKQQGMSKVVIKEKYRLDTSELFEFEAVKGGKKFLGAGQAGTALLYEEGAPEAALPVIYTFLGKLQREEL